MDDKRYTRGSENQMLGNIFFYESTSSMIYEMNAVYSGEKYNEKQNIPHCRNSSKI